MSEGMSKPLIIIPHYRETLHAHTRYKNNTRNINKDGSRPMEANFKLLFLLPFLPRVWVT